MNLGNPHPRQLPPDLIEVPNIIAIAMKAVSKIEAMPNAKSRELGLLVLESNLRIAMEAIKRARARLSDGDPGDPGDEHPAG